MATNEKNIDFSKILCKWYLSNKRDLPWRDTSDAYTIWISEIILQQTRVEQGRDYFLRFMHRFPTIKSLAEAEENEVLKYWQGLGYYSRARNLHFAAKQITDRFGGFFPHSFDDVRSLKGVGDYTASAICSFAYGLPYAVLDGNVYRVLSRFFGIDTPIDTSKAKKEFSELAQFVMDKKNPSIHNQAMMDFGATLCTPLAPKCDICPLSEQCLALADGNVSVLPRKSKKIVSKNRFFNYFYIKNNGKIYLHKRTANDIWKNMYELPLIETPSETALQDLLSQSFLSELNLSECTISESFSTKHILTHQNIFAKFYILYFPKPQPDILCNFIELNENELENYPIARLIEIFIEKRL